ncbi:hypothetical protein VaNZ11_007589, partial [Volvox africanus]
GGGGGCSSSACSGVFSPASPMSPVSGTADSEGWSVAGGNLSVPRSSCPAGTAGPITGTSPTTTAEGVSRRQPVDGGGSTEPPSAGTAAAAPPPPLVAVPVPAALAEPAPAPPGAPPVAGAATAAPAAEAAITAAAPAVCVPPAAAVQWVVRPGPPLESAYVLGDILGKGSFGVVRAATHLATGAKVAVKTIRKSLLGAADVSALRREVEILHHLSGHPHISQLLGVYEEPSQLHLVMELCQGGDLFDAIIAVGRHSERAAADVMRTVLTALSYCHAMGVAHRDIKPENFMLTASLPPGAGPGEAGAAAASCHQMGASTSTSSSGGGDRGDARDCTGSKLKLIDFGLSVFCPSDSVPLTDTVGTSYYVAPEVLARSYSRSADVWSAGVILHILLTGYAPFDGRNDQEILRAVQTGKLDLTTDPIWASISRDATAVVTAMLNRDPAKRATADEVLAMPWLGRTAASCTASTTPLPGVVSDRMRRFARMNSFKKEARRVVAGLMRPEEVAGLVAQFKSLDADGDGKLNVQELRDGLARQELHPKGGLVAAGAEPGRGPGPLREDELKELVERSDLNGDGLLDQSEFLGAALPTAAIARQAQQALAAVTLARPGSRANGAAAAVNNPLAAAFAHFDADSSGFITPDELRSALAAHHPESQGPDIRALLSRVDRDADGRISYPEFVDMLVQEIDDEDEPGSGGGGGRNGPTARGSAATPKIRSDCGVAVAVPGSRTAAGAQRLKALETGVGPYPSGRGGGGGGGGGGRSAAAKRQMQVPAAWGVGGPVPPPPVRGAARGGRNGQNNTTSFRSMGAAPSGGSGGLSSFDWYDECNGRAETSCEGDEGGGWMHGKASATATVADAKMYGSSVSEYQSQSRQTLGAPAAAHEGLYRAAETAALTLLGGDPGGESSLLGQMGVGVPAVRCSAPGWAPAAAAAAAGPGYTAHRPQPLTIPPPPPAASRRARRHSAAEALEDGYANGYGEYSRGGDGGGAGGNGRGRNGRFGNVMERVVRVSRISEGQTALTFNHQYNHHKTHKQPLPVNGPRQHAAMYPGSTTQTRGVGVGPSPLGGHRGRHKQMVYGNEDKAYQRGPCPTAVLQGRGRVGGGGGGGVSAPVDHLVSPVSDAGCGIGGGSSRQRGAAALQPRALVPVTAVSDYPAVGHCGVHGGGGGGGGGQSGHDNRRTLEYPDQALAMLHGGGGGECGGGAASAAFSNEAAAVLPPGTCEEQCYPDSTTTTARHRRSLASAPSEVRQIPHQQQRQLSPCVDYPPAAAGCDKHSYGSDMYSEPLPYFGSNLRGSQRQQLSPAPPPAPWNDASRGVGRTSPRGDGIVL